MSTATDAAASDTQRAPLALGTSDANAAADRPPAVSRPRVPVRGLGKFVQGSLTPYVSRQVQAAGRTGVVGAALLVFAAGFFFSANSPLRSELAGLQSTLDAARASSHALLASLPAPQSELDAFVKRLPGRAELPALTGQIVAQAAAAGIALDHGTYDIAVTHSGQLVRARLSFPVHGRYPDIRRFIDATLAAIPGAAIDALSFERKTVGDAEVDADVRFAIYVRAGA